MGSPQIVIVDQDPEEVRGARAGFTRVKVYDIIREKDTQ